MSDFFFAEKTIGEHVAIVFKGFNLSRVQFHHAAFGWACRRTAYAIFRRIGNVMITPAAAISFRIWSR
jgi:hypothetical protein